MTTPSPRAAVLAVALALPIALPMAAAAADPIADPFRTEARLEARLPPLPDCDAVAVPPAPLALAAAVDFALCRNPQTRAAWSSARQQAAALGIARGAWLPTLQGSAGVDSTSGSGARTTLPSGDGRRRGEDASLALSWTLFDFGARGARIRGAEQLLDAAAASAGATAQQVVYGAVQAYFDVAAATAALEATRVAESAAARSLEVARGRLAAGVATRADRLQAETALAQAVLTRVQSEGALADARGRLAVQLGLPADVRLDPAPGAIPDDVPALQTRVAELLALAESQRPDLAAARARRGAAEADVAGARAAGRPVVSVGATQSWTATQGFPDRRGDTVGLNVTIPIYTGHSTTYRLRQAEAALAASDADAERIRLQVSLDVWTAYAGLASATEQLRATRALVESAVENERVALGRFEAGVGTIVDVLTAQSAAASARQQRIGAERAWQVSRAQLALATGRLASAAPLAAAGGVP